jgi:glycosyltransferase involved in cell wall biosynthesis
MAARFPVGGIRTFLRQVYSQPVFGDCEITLLAPSKDLGDFLGLYIPKKRLIVQNVPGAPGQFLRETRAALKSGSFDLLHTHGLTTAAVGEIARTGTDTPHLATIHDVFLPTTFQGTRGRVQQVGLNLLMRRCDAIHAVSEDCARNFREYLPLVKQERVHAILNGIDTETILNATPVDIRAELALPPGMRLFGFFGRFMAQKGFRTLVDAVDIVVQQSKKPAFKVLTFGWGGFIREDFQYLQEKGLGEYFVQRPHTDEPYRWMKAMDCVVMPSRWEACGLVAMEALAAGSSDYWNKLHRIERGS